jgi:hypothetical protein
MSLLPGLASVLRAHLMEICLRRAGSFILTRLTPLDRYYAGRAISVVTSSPISVVCSCVISDVS